METYTPTQFKIGDWVFCEFKLQIIEEIKDGRITCVSDGHSSHSSWTFNDRCFPLEKRVKTISDYVDFQYQQIQNLRNKGLNYPDIYRWFVDKWCEMCNNRNDTKLVNKLTVELNEFTTAIVNRCKDLKNETVGGINLFRK